MYYYSLQIKVGLKKNPEYVFFAAVTFLTNCWVATIEGRTGGRD
jgi:hypothetical protein